VEPSADFRVLAVSAALLVGLIGAVPSASAGGPPEDSVITIGPIVEEVNCDAGSLTRTQMGWVGLPADAETPTFYHLTWTYSSADGKVWSFIDTGLVRTFERDGDLYVSLSGRSTNVGPGDTSWVGHWELTTVTSDVLSVGVGFGDIDQLACNVLASS
jgi:hypothetical protein